MNGILIHVILDVEQSNIGCFKQTPPSASGFIQTYTEVIE